MRGWILSHLEDSPSIALLLEACRAGGHLVDLVHPKDCVVRLGDNRPPTAASTDIVPDIVVTRLGSTAPGYALAVRALESPALFASIAPPALSGHGTRYG
ncbi:MAG TPA: hypothetical protein VIE66_18780 [Methylocella sp.]|jgi:hypothetical protein